MTSQWEALASHSMQLNKKQKKEFHCSKVTFLLLLLEIQNLMLNISFNKSAGRDYIMISTSNVK